MILYWFLLLHAWNHQPLQCTVELRCISLFHKNFEFSMLCKLLSSYIYTFKKLLGVVLAILSFWIKSFGINFFFTFYIDTRYILHINFNKFSLKIFELCVHWQKTVLALLMSFDLYYCKHQQLYLVFWRDGSLGVF